LASQLCSIKWEVDSRGRIKVERKKEYMPRRGLASPDRADAVAMALVEHAPPINIAAHTKRGMFSADLLTKEW
jgi:hypothetical protein